MSVETLRDLRLGEKYEIELELDMFYGMRLRFYGRDFVFLLQGDDVYRMDLTTKQNGDELTIFMSPNRWYEFQRKHLRSKWRFVATKRGDFDGESDVQAANDTAQERPDRYDQ